MEESTRRHTLRSRERLKCSYISDEECNPGNRSRIDVPDKKMYQQAYRKAKLSSPEAKEFRLKEQERQRMFRELLKLQVAEKNPFALMKKERILLQQRERYLMLMVLKCSFSTCVTRRRGCIFGQKKQMLIGSLLKTSQKKYLIQSKQIAVEIISNYWMKNFS